MKAHIKSSGNKRGATVFTAAVVLAMAGNLQADTVKVLLEIDKQQAGTALMELAEKSGIQIMVPQNIGKNVNLPALNGEYTVSQALDVLLYNSGLTYEFASEDTVVIKNSESGKDKRSYKKKELTIEEMVVTATKRGSTNLLDTEMSISTLGQEDMERKGYVSMSDYLSTIPGVSQLDMGPGYNKLSMRGIGAGGFADSTVGLYLGEVPLSRPGGSDVDIKLVDIHHVEILRGPQGTLFGSGTMGGAVRNIPNAPNLDEFEAELQAGGSYTDGSGGMNNKVNGVINVPMIEGQLALRVAAYRIENRGYVDMVSSSDAAAVVKAANFGGVLNNRKDVNDSEFSGVRATLLWQPTDNLSFTLMHVTQDLNQDGMAYVDLEKGGYRGVAFEFNGLFGGQEGRSDEIDLTSLVIEYDLDWGNLTSVSTTRKDRVVRDLDDSRFLPWPTAQTSISDTEGFSQELRVNSQLDGPLQFLGGLYYEDLQTTGDGILLWSGDGVLDPFAGASLFGGESGEFIEQMAAFGEVSYELIDQFKLTVGGRWFSYDRRTTRNLFGIFAPTPFDRTSDETGSKGKINLAYTPNDDTLIYAQWAEGFRLGKPVDVPNLATCDVNNDGILDGTNTPINTGGELDSDSLESIELGFKFSLLDNQMVLNGAIYRISWDGIPVSVFPPPGGCGLGTTWNAGEAQSHGLELETSYMLAEQLRVDFGFGYYDAELAVDSPGGGLKGDRLPFSPRANANIGVDYSFELAGYESFIHLNYSYVGGFHSDLAGNTSVLGDYVKLNLRAGVAINEHLSFELYGKNLGNADDLAGVDFGFGRSEIRLVPRVIGLDVNYSF